MLTYRLCEELGSLKNTLVLPDGLGGIHKPQHLAQQVANMMRQHRVLRVAYQNIQQVRERNPFFQHLHQEIEQLLEARRFSSIASTVQNETVRGVLRNNDVMFIKGAAVSLLYPAHFVRDRGDIDIIVQDFEDLWSIIEVTADLYEAKRLKIHIYPGDLVSGSIELRPRAQGGQLPIIDVHIGSFHIWGGAHYSQNLWSNKLNMHSSVTPSWEDSLLLVAAHIATDWYYRLRDINDVYTIVYQNPYLNWDYIIKVARQENILSILSFLFTEVERVYGEALSIPKPLLNKQFSTSLFAKFNYGKSSLKGGLILQSVFTYESYKGVMKPIEAILNSIVNSYNMIFSHNRAYSIAHSKQIRRFRGNEVLILTCLYPSPERAILKINTDRFKGIFHPQLLVINPGTETEGFLAKDYVWVQANYQGEVKENREVALTNYFYEEKI